VSARRRFDVSYSLAFAPERVWSFVSWTGVERLAGCGAFTAVTLESRAAEPGAVRYTHLADGSRITERLQCYEPDRLRYEYTIDDDDALPVQGYRGLVEVSSAPGGARLRFAHDAQVKGMTPEQWRAAWLEIESTVVRFIESRLAAGE